MVRHHIRGSVLTGTLAAAGACALLLTVALWMGAPVARGQQRSVITPQLNRALARARSAERVPVVIEFTRVSAPAPLAPGRRQRAAEYAGNLAQLYSSAAEELRRSLPASVSVDIQAGGRVLWIGGAISAQLTPAQIRSLEGEPGVRRIHYDGLVEVELAGSAARGGSAESPPLMWAPGFPVQDPAGGLPWGLVAIGAPEVWASGATGQGTVVASIDSGVDGTHPLLWRRWRGRNVAPELAWFDPWGLSATPEDDDGLGGVGHGTIVMATAVGALEPGDTLITLGGPQVVRDALEVVTGVAPGAEWVAANGFEGFGTGQYTRLSVLLQAMQWVLDPDGDPATVTDIPDVLNNSWGFRTDGCDGTFDRAIDNLELAGVPVVFASGNRSAGFDTVATPASRADLLLNAFAVGAAELRDGEIVVSDRSLGGPSPCAPGAVKPEVVAPGEVALLRNRGPRTAEVRGRSGSFTSWAAPHVTGSLAVLRGLNPAASANDLKDALFSTAEDLPPPGLDNRSGSGFIDLAAAAEAIGGLGGVRLAVEGWRWDVAGATLSLQLLNRGTRPFPGGTAELRGPAGTGVETGRTTLASAPAPPIGPRARGAIVFHDPSGDPTAASALTLRLKSDGASLDFVLLLAAPTASSVELTDGSVSFTLDGNGRLGGVAGAPGFLFLGEDRLPGGGFLFGIGDRVSDAAYVDVLQRPALKPNPVGSDTDWRNIETELVAGNRASLDFGDDRALRPLGASVSETVELRALGDSAAFVVLETSVTFSSAGTSLAGVFLDWDFGRDSVVWDAGLGASVMTSADSSGPWMALTALPAPATHAAVPLGSADFEFYAAGSGVLAKLEGFGDGEKARLMRLGGLQVSSGGTDDWAQLVTVGPVRSSEPAVFLVAAGRSRRALRAALDSARAFVARSASQPVISGSRALEVLPAYPNPFNPLEVGAVSFPFLVNRGSERVKATLRVYTISGIQLYEERRELVPDVPVEPFRWNGRLANGEAAASGVYGYVIRVGDERRWGKFLLLK